MAKIGGRHSASFATEAIEVMHAASVGGDEVKSTSRILVGLMASRGMVGP